MTESVTWVKWHFAKWRGDPMLRMCGLAARGLWADLLSVMHECEPYGHLVINGKSPSARQIASIVGMTNEKEVAALLQELVDNGVCSVTDNGIIYSRRLVRDKDMRDRGRATGSLGGNPSLKNRDNQIDPEQDKGSGSGGLTPPVNGSTNGSGKPHSLSPPVNPEKEKEYIPPVVPPNEPSLFETKADAPCDERKVPTKRGSRLPEDWAPSKRERDYAASLGVDLAKAVEEFRNYWLSRAGKDAVKIDWDLTFRNRLLELSERGKFKVDQRHVRIVSDTNPAGRAFTPMVGGL